MSTVTNQIMTDAPAEVVALLHAGAGDTRAVQLLERACQLARLAHVPWERTADGGWPAVEAPSIALGLLPPGERRAPAALGLATRAYPGLPTVLVAGERLSREVVVLNRGQLSLIDPGVSAERLAGYLRKVTQSFGRATPPAFTACYTRVFRPVGGWAAALTRYPSPREVYETEITFPWVSAAPGRAGFACVLPSWGQVAKFGPQVCEQARSAFAGAPTMEELVRLGDAVGTGVSLLVIEHDIVRVFAPPGEGSAWVISPRRLPHVHRFAEGAVHRLRPAPGDLFVVTSLTGWVPPEGTHGLGGAEVLRAILDEVGAVARPAAAALYEVW